MKERCGKKWLIVHWTHTGNVPKEYDDDDDDFVDFLLNDLPMKLPFIGDN